MDLSKFGITDEELEKGADIVPTFSLGKDLPVGSKVIVEILEKEPREIEVKDIYGKEEKKKTSVLNVFVKQVSRPNGEEFLVIPIEEERSIYLTSKTLALGFGRIYKKYNGDFKGVMVKIHKTTAEYKQGENICYNVTELKREEN